MSGYPTFVINVRGTRFEITRNTLNKLVANIGSSRLEEALVIGKDQMEYYFERHPACFGAVLDYLRHGELHLPPAICPKLFGRELAFWGIDVAEMENCCYHSFVMFMEDRKTLQKFEKQALEKCKAETKPPNSRLGRTKAEIWAFLEDPASSMAAKIYMTVVVLFVLASIFVVVASTHHLFQRNLKRDEWADFLGDNLDEYLPSLKKVLPAADLQYLYDDYDYSKESDATTENPDSLKGIDDAGEKIKDTKIALAFARLDWLKYIEYAAIVFFTVEFVLRLIVCPSLKMYVCNMLNIFDFIALTAMFISGGLEVFVPEKRYTSTTSDFINSVQFMRTFRFLRLAKNVTGFRVLVFSFTSSAKELLLLLLFLSMGILGFGSLMFYAEDISNMKSIPDASWWALITMTTVGYGDLIPKTFAGRVIAAACAVSGVLLIAVTVPIFVNTFILFYSYSKVMDARILEEDARINMRRGKKLLGEQVNKIVPISDMVDIKSMDT